MIPYLKEVEWDHDGWVRIPYYRPDYMQVVNITAWFQNGRVRYVWQPKYKEL